MARVPQMVLAPHAKGPQMPSLLQEKDAKSLKSFNSTLKIHQIKSKISRCPLGLPKEDLQRQHTPPKVYNFILQELENIFKYHGRSCEQLKLLTPILTVVQHTRKEIYNVKEEGTNGKLNLEQKEIAEEVLHGVKNQILDRYFIDGPGCSSKILFYKTLYHTLRENSDEEEVSEIEDYEKCSDHESNSEQERKDIPISSAMSTSDEEDVSSQTRTFNIRNYQYLEDVPLFYAKRGKFTGKDKTSWQGFESPQNVHT
ncbi:hypothetical protein EVAR_85220_1 [Eumeta japonica]|uniref:Uncharacterized protein n=1 Tax=Eumeta variegata TaxID=151549 RepID=A0A4C1VXR7_EUMVA|nr:hypothetical protein EVAR_85220_1 [Eumeta japonica]